MLGQPPKILKRSKIDMLREEIKWDYIKGSIKTRNGVKREE